jgi:hypothetical protein
VDAAADQKTPAAGTVEEFPSAVESKRFNKKGAKEFVARHCEDEEKGLAVDRPRMAPGKRRWKPAMWEVVVG